MPPGGAEPDTGPQSQSQSQSQSDPRRAELAGSLQAVRARLVTACTAAGRPSDSVTLIAVTKRYPVEDAQRLLDLGVTDLGESRDQEARPKAEQLPAARWHFVGQLQSNKAKYVVRYARAVHSVDRSGLVASLAAAMNGRDREPLEVFLQVSLDGDPARAGADPDAVPALGAEVTRSAGLQLAGVMAVAPMGQDPRSAFARLREVSESLRAEFPAAVGISAGMSHDLEAAIGMGATHVRVGTALLGVRSLDVG